jgi:iron complex transport system substrate-binding protein
LFLVGRTPGAIGDLVAVGRASYLNELIGLAGGINIAADAAVQYPQFSVEELIHRDPDIIIDMGHGMASDAEKQNVKRIWQKYSFLRAVRNDAVFPISAEYFITPGPRVGQAVRDLIKIFSK